MADKSNLVELNRRTDDLTVDETLARAGREGFDHVVVVGVHTEDRGISIWASGESARHDHWLISKALPTLLYYSD